MASFASHTRRATGLVGLFFVFTGMTSVIYALAGVSPGPAYNFLGRLGDSVVIANWIVADRRSRGHSPNLDAGFFAYVASWPIALGYHLLMTRGVRGGLTFLWVMALLALPLVPAVIISATISRR